MTSLLLGGSCAEFRRRKNSPNTNLYPGLSCLDEAAHHAQIPTSHQCHCHCSEPTHCSSYFLLAVYQALGESTSTREPRALNVSHLVAINIFRKLDAIPTLTSTSPQAAGIPDSSFLLHGPTANPQVI